MPLGTALRALLASVLLAAAASASDIPQEVANQINVSSYQSILANELYTHLGDNRGRYGPEHDLARDNIAALFDSYGLAVTLDSFYYSGATYENVVATQLGDVDPTVIIVIGGHYDSANTPGADDDASGVAGVLEIARVLSQYSTAYTIKYIAFDLEEQGLIGSTHYVNTHDVTGVAAMIQLDMIAWEYGQNRLRLYGIYSSLKNAVAAATQTYSTITPLLYSRLDASDHAPFQNAGVPAVLVIEDSYSSNPCYHRACDSVSTSGYIDATFATEITRAVGAYVAGLAGAGAAGCPGDLTGDGSVDFDDFAALSACWGAPCGDLTGDAITDFDDFAELSSDWGCSALDGLTRYPLPSADPLLELP